MKSEKRRFLIIILILFLVILLLFMIYALRNALILSNIDKMVTNLENSKNVYVKINSYDSKRRIISLTEHYFKDNVYKKIITLYGPPNADKMVITTYTYPSLQKIFTEMGTTRTLNINDNIKAPIEGYHFDDDTYAIIMGLGCNKSFFAKALTGISTNIRTVDKKYYLIKYLISSNYMDDTDAKEMHVYLYKDTGLPFKIQIVQKTDCLECGSVLEKYSLFEYKFDYVTDSDMIEPDEAIFSIHED